MLVISKNKKIVETNSGKELFLYHKDTGAFVVLNEHSAFVWSLIDEHKDVGSLMACIYQEESEGGNDIVTISETILSTLVQMGMIRIMEETVANAEK